MLPNILAAIIPAAIGIVTVAVAGIRRHPGRPKISSAPKIDIIRRV
jgi:hypothetical protein